MRRALCATLFYLSLAAGAALVWRQPVSQSHHGALEPSPRPPLHIRWRWALLRLSRRLPWRRQQQQLPPLHNQGLVAVAYSDPQSGVFLGSPSIARLDADTLLISHDFFPEYGRPKRASVWASKDGGASWQPRATLPMFWPSLFVHRGAAYLLGLDDAEGPNAVTVARSTDGGATWNVSAVMRAMPGCHFATGSVPVLLEGGAVFRGVELWCGPALHWPQDFYALVAWAPAGADLLDPAAWRASEAARFDSASMLPDWFPGPVTSAGYLEGNAVRLPGGGGIGLLLRCRAFDDQGRFYGLQQACLFHVKPPPAEGELALPGPAQQQRRERQQQAEAAWQGVEPAAGGSTGRRLKASEARQQTSGAEPPPRLHLAQHGAAGQDAPKPLQLEWQGFVDMPGGGQKFTVHFDASTGLYLSLTNPSIDRYGSNPDARNILTLVFSPNLLDWRIATTVLVPNDGLSWEQSLWSTGYQYVDWIADGDDLLLAIRTAWNGANTYHNSNFITFKRVRQYRQYLPGGSGPGASASAAGGGMQAAAAAAA